MNKRIVKKKKYIAIAAVSSLLLTGGVIGATVTAESTITGNSVNVTNPPGVDANIVVTGNPLKIDIAKGIAPSVGTYPVADAVGTVEWTLKNTGGTTAVITPALIPELDQPAPYSGTAGWVGVYMVVNGKQVAKNIIAPNSSSTRSSFTLAPGASVKAVVYMWGGTGGAYFKNLGNYNATFNAAFDYTNAP